MRRRSPQEIAKDIESATIDLYMATTQEEIKDLDAKLEKLNKELKDSSPSK